MDWSRRPRRRARENIVPLVNIVFLLLIFFMLAGTLRPPEVLEVEPPEMASESSPTRSALHTPTLTLDRDGVMALDGRVVEYQTLRVALLGGAEPGRAPAPIRVRADRRARAEHLLPLLERLSKLGFKDVALVTLDSS